MGGTTCIAASCPLDAHMWLSTSVFFSYPTNHDFFHMSKPLPLPFTLPGVLSFLLLGNPLVWASLDVRIFCGMVPCAHTRLTLPRALPQHFIHPLLCSLPFLRWSLVCIFVTFSWLRASQGQGPCLLLSVALYPQCLSIMLSTLSKCSAKVSWAGVAWERSWQKWRISFYVPTLWGDSDGGRNFVA